MEVTLIYRTKASHTSASSHQHQSATLRQGH
jgi:hypothetical protein